MAKIQVGLRVDDELLAVVDRIAIETGESRTDVMMAALERGLYEEERFIASEKVPVLRSVVATLQKAGVADIVARMLGTTVDPRKVRIAEHLRDERRKGRLKRAAKGV